MDPVRRDTDKVEDIMRPSQLVNILWLGITIWLLFTETPEWAALPGFIWFCKYLIIYNWEFQIGERTITERKGVFSVETVEIHYFRIKSVIVEEPFFLRIFGLSNVILMTSDPIRPVFELYAIENGDEVRKYVKDMTYFWRDKMGVKETDFHNF